MVVGSCSFGLRCCLDRAGEDAMTAQQLESRIRSFVPLVCVLIGIVLLFSGNTENRVLGAFLTGLGLGEGL